MKNRQASKAPSAKWKYILQTIIGAVLMTALILYNLWTWVLVPQHQQDFNRQVGDNIENYRKRIEAYLIRLQKPLYKMANDFPRALLLPSEPNALNDLEQEAINNKQEAATWLLQYQQTHEKTLEGMKLVAVFSAQEIGKYVGLSPQAAANNNISFIFIDMVNRLQKNKLLFVEVAKIPDADIWELHQIVPIRDSSGSLVGILHATFSLEQLKSLFTASDLSLGQIKLIQTIENEESLAFLHVGNSASQFLNKTKTINNSHWQMTYKPSVVLSEQAQQMPLWFFAVGLLIPALFFIIAIYSLRQKNSSASSEKKKSPKANKKIDDTSELSAASAANNIEDADEPLLTNDVSVPDSIFRAYDIRGIAYEQLSPELVSAIGQAVATEVLAAGDKAMMVGYDARTHSPEFATCIIEGIISTGCDVINIGLVPTPLLNFSACEHQGTSSGVIITASHNPKEYNGCKMVVQGQTLVDEDIQRLKTRIIQGDVISSATKGNISEEDFAQAYIDRIAGDLAIMEGWRVVIDSGNGGASELAPRLFQALQCETTPLFCEFDGEFPNHDPDPSVAENLVALIQAVKDKKADIGFAFDGDGDRVMVVTASGKILWPDQLLMLFAQDVVARNPGCDVVFDIKSTQLLSETIVENGGRPVMWKTGHSHIKSKMRETQALLGGEYSGHIFFKERWYGFDDGMYAAARLLELMTLTGQSIDQMLAQLPVTVSTPEIKVAITEESKFTFIDKLIQQAKFPSGQLTVIDGLRVDYDNGWGLVRASNTAPVLTLRFEAADENELKKIQKQFKQQLHNIDKNLNLPF
jgi:phosphomannomutase/phosphoglucomutase